MLRHLRWQELGIAAAITGAEEGDCGAEGGRENRQRALEALGADPFRVQLLRQVHGTRVVPGGDAAGAEADGLHTATPGLPLGILVADCVPVWIVDPVLRVGAIVHAGREGTRHAIAAEAVRVLKAEHGTAPESLEAWIGPSAGPCCYEVSAEMADAWRAAGLPAEGRRLDLWSANRLQLEGAGLDPAAIALSGHCTICQPGYFSYRRDGTAARNLGILML